MKRILIILFLGVSFLSLLSMNTLDSDNHQQTLKNEILNHNAPAAVSDSLVADSVNIVDDEAFDDKGAASWYGKEWNGRTTASGEKFDTNALTAAHKSLPFGTKVKLRNPQNGKEVVVTITDRGPFVKSRIFDLSQAAFKELGDLDTGVLRLEYKVLD